MNSATSAANQPVTDPTSPGRWPVRRILVFAWLIPLALFALHANAETSLQATLTLLQNKHPQQARWQAVRDLARQALAQPLEQTDPSASAGRVLNQLSDQLLSLGDSESALLMADHALANAGTETPLRASALNHQGNALAVAGKLDQAAAAHAASQQLAEQLQLKPLALAAALNRIHDQLAMQQRDSAAKAIPAAARLLAQLDPAMQHKPRLSLGILARRAGAREIALQLLNHSAQHAQQTDHWAAASMARGQLAQLYADHHQPDDALLLAEQAVFHAQQANVDELLVRWLHLLGNLQQQMARPDQALANYRQAIQRLEPIRDTLFDGYRKPTGDFDDSVAAIHFSLVDLLLEKAESLQPSEQRQALLREARDTVEKLRMVELENHFQDECVARARKQQKNLDDLAAGSAVIYPVILPNRTVLLLSDAQGIQQYSVPVGRDQLTRTVLQFRGSLQTRPDNRYLGPARQLYRWLIEPLEAELQQRGVDTLVMVPDGPLRTVPLTALYSGSEFLIERYALVVTPSLRLTDPTPFQAAENRVLVAGLSDGVQSFAPLPGVPRELASIEQTTGALKMLNDEYNLEAFRAEVQQTPYSVIHLATHGQFTGDQENTFLLAYDDKLTMDRLESIIGYGRFREKPLELLSLSACQTALGDERAALGLAGIAVKAGARSAIATLWFVDDEATSLAMTRFYSTLFDGSGKSRAKALQQVQVQLLRQPRFRHPAYWAPFLLIGNWM